MSIGSVKEKVSAAIAAGSKSGAKVTLDEARAIVTEAKRGGVTAGERKILMAGGRGTVDWQIP